MIEQVSDRQSLLDILRVVHQGRRLTRAEIVRATGLSLGHVSRVTRELAAARLLREEGSLPSSNGRRARFLALNPAAASVVGVELDGRHERAIVCDARGHVLSSTETPASLTATRAEILTRLERLIDEAIGRAGLARDDILGAGIGLHGIVDPATGMVHGWPNTPEWHATWSGFDLLGALRERLPWRHIVVEDSVRAMGLMEARRRPEQPPEDFLFLWADAGIGSAIVLNRTPYLGPAHMAGEIGHIGVTDARTTCHCGNTGCLESVASARAIVQEARRRLGESYTISSLTGRDANLSAADLVAESESGDKLAYHLVHQAGDFTGRALAIVLNLLSFRLVVVGGELSRSRLFIRSAAHAARLHALPQVTRQLRVEVSEADEWAGSIGGANLVLDRLFSRETPAVLEHQHAEGVA